MEKISNSSLSSKSSRGSTSRAPVPLPRTKFLAEPNELLDEEGRKTQSKKKAWKKEHKPKGTYSMIKDLLPNRKPKNSDQLSDKSERSSKFHKSKPDVPPRPRQIKHKQGNPSRNEQSKVKEHLPSKYGSVEKRDGHMKTSQSERSLQDIFPSTGSHHREVNPPTDPLLAVLAPPSSDNRGNMNPSHGPSQTERAPGLSLLSQVTTQPKITTKEQLVEKSQKAMECIQEARGAFSNSQYNKAARKYQTSLDLIDNVLETPLSSLHLTEAEEDKAQTTIFEVRLLRKDALQGFSDCQCEYSLPQSTVDLPTGAPPTYNDVLKEDLLMNNPTTFVGASPLVPSLANGSKTSQNTDLVAVDPRTPDATGSRFQAQQTSRNESQLFFTPRKSIPNSHEVRDGSEIPLSSNRRSKNDRHPAVALKPNKLVMHGQPTIARNIPWTSDGKPSMSVRPKIRPISAHKKKPVFPPDVDVKAPKNKPRNDPVIPKKSEKSNKYPSNESLSSETSFKSALSTPKVTPRTGNVDALDHFGTKSQPNHKYPVLDPFTFEDPFPEQEPTPKSSHDAFSHMNGESISPSSKRLTHKMSFLPSTSYHTEIVRHHDTNPFLNSTIDSPLNASNSVNPFLQQPTDMALRGGTSHQFVTSTNQIAQPYPVVGVSSSGKNFNYPDGHFSNGKLGENLPTKLEKSVAYETSFSVDDSMITQRKTKEINPTDTFTKRNRLTKSVVDLSAKKQSVTKTSKKRRKISKMKKLSRSNESILLMFDPIVVENSSSSDTGSESDGDDFMVDKNTIQSNPVYGTNQYATSATTQNNTPSNGQRENGVVAGTTENRKETNDPVQPLLVIDRNEDDALPILNGHPNDESGRPHSLYPKLSVSEGLSNRPLPELPRRPQQPDPLPRSNFVEAREITNISFKRRVDEISISAEKDNRSSQSGRFLQSARPGHEEKENKTHKSRSSKESRHRSRQNIDEIGGEMVGRSAFYGDSEKPPSLPHNARGRDSTPAAPPRSSSSKKDNPWQEIVQVNEAVKLFFLSDAGVSSPFNRQSLLLLRKYEGRNGGDGDKARIEVGGELFARDLHNKNTMVMLDHHGDYIVQSSPGVFLCMVLCSKVKKRDALALEKTFEIYANFAKESQMMKLPGGMESAAANVKKAVKDKAPGVMKTTSFVKRNSLRALRKLKGAIVGGEEDDDPPKQELGIEFLPLKKACEKFRETRQLKNVRYF